MRLVNLNIQKISTRKLYSKCTEIVNGNILIKFHISHFKFHQRPQRYFKEVTDPSVVPTGWRVKCSVSKRVYKFCFVADKSRAEVLMDTSCEVGSGALFPSLFLSQFI